MQTEIKKWGNSAVVRLPATLLKQLNITVGSPITIIAENDTILITPASPKLKLADLLAGITSENLHSEMDWGQPVGKEEVI
jgi:antitoxin MazE